MGLSESERFQFDLAGFLVRPAILTENQVADIRQQIERIKHDPQSLPPQHRSIPGGPASLLIDHPKVIDVLHDVIGPNIRLEACGAMWRQKGEQHGQLHGGGPKQIDPIFGYRVQNGQIQAGMVRVIFEFSEIRKEDGATHFIVGSHKANFPMHPDHMELDQESKRSPFLVSYDCPPGSAVFFSENTCHAGPRWKGDEPRVAILHAYSHLATHWHRLNTPAVILESLPPQKQAYFREPWWADFRTQPARHNTIERFVEKGESVILTDHEP